MNNPVIYAFIRADGKYVYVGSTMNSSTNKSNRLADHRFTLNIAKALGAPEGSDIKTLETFGSETTARELRKREEELIKSYRLQGHPLINKTGQRDQ
jgi:GIY-YIG catalytic domain-containing protein